MKNWGSYSSLVEDDDMNASALLMHVILQHLQERNRINLTFMMEYILQQPLKELYHKGAMFFHKVREDWYQYHLYI